MTMAMAECEWETTGARIPSLAACLAAFAAREMPPARSQAMAQFLREAGDYAATRLTAEELAWGARVKSLSDQSRSRAREMALTEAFGLLGRAERILGKHMTSHEASLLGRAETLPAEAQVEIEDGNWSRAAELLRESARVDALLEARYGHRIKSAHRIHLVTVVASLDFLRGNLPLAARRLRAGIELLLGLPSDEKSLEIIDARTLGAFSPELAAALILQFLTASAQILAATPAQSQAPLLDALARPVAMLSSGHAGSNVAFAEVAGLLEYIAAIGGAGSAGPKERIEELVLRQHSFSSGRVFRLLAIDAVCAAIESGAASAPLVPILDRARPHDSGLTQTGVMLDRISSRIAAALAIRRGPHPAPASPELALSVQTCPACT